MSDERESTDDTQAEQRTPADAVADSDAPEVGSDDDEPGDDEPNDDEPGDDEPNDDQARDEPGAPTRRRDAPRWAVAAGLAVLGVAVLVGAVVRREPPPLPEGVVILYGDSLSMEASAGFVPEMGRIANAELVVRPVPGTSPCDALDQMHADVALEPDVVVIQYVGNNASECVRGPDGEELTGTALVERFEADVRTATELFATNGVRVVLVGGPHSPGLPGKASLGIADAYNRIVNEWAGRDLGRVRYADAAATVTGDDHVYADRLPCRDDEGPDDGCVDGEVTVRHHDRIHFCPAEYGELVCAVPSPGAIRFGEEMARVAALALDPSY